MRRSVLVFVALLCLCVARAQNVTIAYQLSRISNYIQLDGLAKGGAAEVMDTVCALHDRFHSVDYIFNILDTKDTDKREAKKLLKALRKTDNRLAFIVGPHTDIAMLRMVMDLRREKRCILAGDVEGAEFMDIALSANDSYLTQWYDSLHRSGVVPVAAQSYVAKHPLLTTKYKDAVALARNFDDNAAIIDILNEEAMRVGIAFNEDAFMYSAFTLLAELKAELVRCLYPDDKVAYYIALNSSIGSAIKAAQDAIESPAYRDMLKK